MGWHWPSAGSPNSKLAPAAAHIFPSPVASIVTCARISVLVFKFSTTTPRTVLSDSNTVRGVVVENLKTRTEILAQVTIDATGDGNICAAAGASFEFGDPAEGHCQPRPPHFWRGGV